MGRKNGASRSKSATKSPGGASTSGIVATPTAAARSDDTVVRLPGGQQFTCPELADVVYQRIEASLSKKIEVLVQQRVDAAVLGMEDRLVEKLKAVLEEMIKPIVQKVMAEPSAKRPAWTEAQISAPHALSRGVPLNAGAQQRVSFCAALRQAPLLEKKSRYAVIERLPERETDEADDQYISNVVGQVAGKIDAEVEIQRVFRHGKRRDEQRDEGGESGRPRRPRIVKVEFANTEQRDGFIAGFRRALEKPEQDRRPMVFARRDMIPYELQIQVELRRECYELNKAAGEIQYYYFDLKIRKCKKNEDGSYRKFTDRDGTVEAR